MTDRSLEFAESTRDTAKHERFLGGLFEGEARFNLMLPFPEQSQESKEKMAELLQKLEKILVTSVDSEKIDATGEIPESVIRQLVGHGFFGIKIPQKYGGLGLSQSEYKEVAVMIGGWDASLTALISAHNSIGLPQPLIQFGTEEQKARLLPAVASGNITGFALTEDEAGSDLTRIRTYAQRIKNPSTGKINYRIFGKKLYTTNAVKNDKEFLATFLVVIARVVDSPSELDNPEAKIKFGAFVVYTGSPSIKVEHRCHFMGLKAIYNGVISFDGIFVPAYNRIGEEGDGIRVALSTLAIGRLTLPAACAGGLKQTLAISRWWGAKRIQWFNRRIGDHELIAKKLTDMAAHLLALESMVAITCRWADEKKDVRLESAACKILGSKWLWEDLSEALQIRSGRGYETAASQSGRGEFPIAVEQMLRDARINLIFEGTNEIMRLWQAREEMDPYVKRGMIIEKGSMLQKVRAISEICWKFICRKPNHFKNAEVPPPLKKHIKFVTKEARRLTRVAIAATIFYQRKLIKKQLVMARLADTAMELFAIAAICSRAASKPEAVELANYFCWEARKRINPPSNLWEQIFLDPNRESTYQIAQQILDGKMMWLEDGIVPFLDKYPEIIL